MYRWFWGPLCDQGRDPVLRSAGSRIWIRVRRLGATSVSLIRVRGLGVIIENTIRVRRLGAPSANLIRVRGLGTLSVNLIRVRGLLSFVGNVTRVRTLVEDCSSDQSSNPDPFTAKSITSTRVAGWIVESPPKPPIHKLAQNGHRKLKFVIKFAAEFSSSVFNF